MKVLFTLLFSLVLLINVNKAQGFDGPAGTFVGPVTQVVCGNTQVTNAVYYIVLTADDYSEAREVAKTTMERFLGFYREFPSYLGEFYNCRPIGCKAPASCDSYAEIIDIDPIQLLPIGGNLYVLQMDINYKVACYSCKE